MVNFRRGNKTVLTNARIILLICFDVMSFVMSFALECIVTLWFDAQLTGTSLVKDTSLVIDDVALFCHLQFRFLMCGSISHLEELGMLYLKQYHWCDNSRLLCIWRHWKCQHQHMRVQGCRRTHDDCSWGEMWKLCVKQSHTWCKLAPKLDVNCSISLLKKCMAMWIHVTIHRNHVTN